MPLKMTMIWNVTRKLNIVKVTWCKHLAVDLCEFQISENKVQFNTFHVSWLWSTEKGKLSSQYRKLICIFFEITASFLVINDDIAREMMILTTLRGILHCYACFKKLGILYTAVSNFRFFHTILEDSLNEDDTFLLTSSPTTSLRDKKPTKLGCQMKRIYPLKHFNGLWLWWRSTTFMNFTW